MCVAVIVKETDRQAHKDKIILNAQAKTEVSFSFAKNTQSVSFVGLASGFLSAKPIKYTNLF